MEDADVSEKTRAAVQWCRHAADHEGRHGGKPWRYLLIPHDAIEANRTLAGLAAQFEVVDQG
jgi:type III restriction enzyme